MPRHAITLARNDNRDTSPKTIGTDAATALSTIRGIDDINIESESESDEKVELSYTWTGTDKFWETDEYLSRYGFHRVW